MVPPVPLRSRRPHDRAPRALVWLVAASAVAIVGCGQAHRAPAERPATPANSAIDPDPRSSDDDQADGVVHVVRRGQTAWRIARAYGVSLATLADANGLDDPTRIAVGDVLFIPGASERLDVAAYPAPVPDPGREGASRSTSVLDRATRLAWPLDDTQVLSPYGVPRGDRRHKGIDLEGRSGQPVFAAASGTVLYAAATMRGYGRTVILDHGDGLTTLYAHNSSLLVRVGDTVERGVTIARVGRTGNATGHHCHFEVRRDDVPVDPLRYLSRDIASGAP